MEVGKVVSDYPWIFVVAAAVAGVIFGLCISFCRWYRRRSASTRVQPLQREDERPWECVEFCYSLLAACRLCSCSRAGQGAESLLDKAVLRLPLTKVTIVVVLVVGTLACDITSLVYTTWLNTRLIEMRQNMEGDPEKVVMDECMRDFEGLSPEDALYLDNHKKCIDQLVGMEELERLPRIRLTVDERLCEPSNLCGVLDPGQCADSADKPGAVSECYELIDMTKAERENTARAKLLDQVEQRCTGKGVWAHHERKVKLEYCMWKHNTVGVCMNSMRTNCPRDEICCPSVQNAETIAAGTVTPRPNQYVCQKSPVVGLYCQHRSFTLPGGNASAPTPLCTDVSCPSFGWCRDFTDIPGLCLGEACMNYQRSLELILGSMIALPLAILIDVINVGLLLAVDRRSKLKSSLHATGSALKLLVYLFCIAGGVQDFVGLAVERRCWNEQGNARIAQAEMHVKLSTSTAVGGAVGSLCLSVLSVRWSNRLVSLPYARGRAQ
mmetsp:Transcript_108540/g.346425  ORF Transcript_108540/g.346425 Transcript_108540/m.346425 type:complete len:496 (-) Transcript_108540:40-1527(-)